MPRQARLDAPNCLHHAMVREIGRRPIFRDDADRKAGDRAVFFAVKIKSSCDADWCRVHRDRASRLAVPNGFSRSVWLTTHIVFGRVLHGFFDSKLPP